MTEEELLHKVEMLEDLAMKQNKALGMTNGLLDLKDQLVRLCEEETEFYKRENKRLTRSLIIFGVALILNVIVHLISLAH